MMVHYVFTYKVNEKCKEIMTMFRYDPTASKIHQLMSVKFYAEYEYVNWTKFAIIGHGTPDALVDQCATSVYWTLQKSGSRKYGQFLEQIPHLPISETSKGIGQIHIKILRNFAA